MNEQQMSDEGRLENLEKELHVVGLLTSRTGTGGGCEALMVWRRQQPESNVLITNGDAQLPYLTYCEPESEDEVIVDEDLVACVYHDEDNQEEHVIIDHGSEDGLLPASLIVAAVRSALEG